jgi:Domain of unknown function (DUF5615)
MLKATDREVSELCFEEDRILVTNNGVDFLDLAEQSGLHPGLVFIPLGSGAEMRGSMRLAIGEIERLAADAEEEPKGLMINSVLEVDEDGMCERFDHPSPQGETSGASGQSS